MGYNSNLQYVPYGGHQVGGILMYNDPHFGQSFVADPQIQNVWGITNNLGWYGGPNPEAGPRGQDWGRYEGLWNSPEWNPALQSSYKQLADDIRMHNMSVMESGTPISGQGWGGRINLNDTMIGQPPPGSFSNSAKRYADAIKAMENKMEAMRGIGRSFPDPQHYGTPSKFMPPSSTAAFAGGGVQSSMPGSPSAGPGTPATFDTASPKNILKSITPRQPGYNPNYLTSGGGRRARLR